MGPRAWRVGAFLALGFVGLVLGLPDGQHSRVQGWGVRPLSGGAVDVADVPQTESASVPAGSVLNHKNVCKLYLGANNETTVYLCGSAHALASSEELARRVVQEVKPDAVFLELCDERSDVLAPAPTDERLAEATLIGALKLRRATPEYRELPILQYLAVYYQARVARKMGVQLGAEFRGAFEESCAQKSLVVLFDRKFSITAQRLKDGLTRWEKLRLFMELMVNIFRLPSEEELAVLLRDGDALNDMLNKVGERYPHIKEVVIDERDRYMLYKLREFAEGAKCVVAIVGAGHIPGMMRLWSEDVAPDEVIGMSQSSEHRSKTLPICYVLNAR